MTASGLQMIPVTVGIAVKLTAVWLALLTVTAEFGGVKVKAALLGVTV
jgi:hypothetical protein